MRQWESVAFERGTRYCSQFLNQSAIIEFCYKLYLFLVDIMTEGGYNGGTLWDTIKNESTMDNYMPHTRVRVKLDPVKLKTSSGAFSESGVWLHFDRELPPRAEFPTPVVLANERVDISAGKGRIKRQYP